VCVHEFVIHHHLSRPLLITILQKSNTKIINNNIQTETMAGLMNRLDVVEAIDKIAEHLPKSPLTVNIIKCFPLISKFQCTENESLLEKLLLEQTKLLQYEYIKKNVDKYEQEYEFCFYKYVKLFKSKVDDAINNTTRAIDKHYRKLAVKIHPDRNGEEFREEFEILTDARDILKEQEWRHLYIEQMGKVVLYVRLDRDLLEGGHNAWINENRPDMAKNLVRRNAPHAQGQNLRIEGGIFHQTPRLPLVNVVDSQKKIVKIYLPVLKPDYEFYNYLEQVHVKFTSVELQATNNDGGGDLKHIVIHSKDDIVMQNNSLCLGEETLPAHGAWKVSWHAEMTTMDDSFGGTYTTAESMEASINVIDLKLIERLKKCDELEEKIIQTARNLMSAITKLRGVRPASDEIKKFHNFHSIVVKARSLLRQLAELLRITNQENKKDASNSAFRQLHQALDSSKEKLEELQRYRESKLKKGALKQFKCYVATNLEDGDACSWMTHIKEGELETEGGNANRLYQLFVEGKGSFLLDLEPEVLRVASQRTELFSARQCNDLAYRYKESLQKEKKEEEERKAAETKRQKEEAERKRIQLEIKRAWIGNYVTFQSLTSASGKEYNGKIGTVVEYLFDEDRYTVQYLGGLNEEWNLDDEAKVFAVKAENIRAYYGYVPKAVSSKKAETSSKNEEEKGTDSSSKIHEDPSSNHSAGKRSKDQDHQNTAATQKNTSIPDIQTQLQETTARERLKDQGHQNLTKPKSKRKSNAQPKLKDQAPREKSIEMEHENVTKLKKKSKADFQAKLSENGTREGLKEQDHQQKKKRNTEFRTKVKDSATFERKRGEGQKNASKQKKKLRSDSRTEPLKNETRDESISIDQQPIGDLNSESTKETLSSSYHPHTLMTENSSKVHSKNRENMKKTNETPAPSEPSLKVKTTNLPKHSRAFHPRSGAVLCRFSTRCRDLPSNSCRFFHPVVTKSSLINENYVVTILGCGNSNLKGLMTDSGAWIGIRKDKKKNKSVIEFAGTEDEVNRAVDLVKHCLGLNVETIAPSEDYENNSIPTSVNLSKHDDGSLPKSGVEMVSHDDKLLEFLQSQRNCIKGSPKSFHNWLAHSEDIKTISDLVEAISDEDYVRECLQPGDGKVGVKGFKRKTFTTAVLAISEMTL